MKNFQKIQNELSKLVFSFCDSFTDESIEIVEYLSESASDSEKAAALFSIRDSTLKTIIFSLHPQFCEIVPNFSGDKPEFMTSKKLSKNLYKSYMNQLAEIVWQSYEEFHNNQVKLLIQ